MPARRIAFMNCKGGVGKTSLTINVAACLVKEFGQKVLIVDLDSQSNSSIWLMGIARWMLLDGMPHKTVMAAFDDQNNRLANAIHQSVLVDEESKLRILPNLDLIPAIYDLADLDHDFKDTPREPYYLRFYREMVPLFDQYDYIFFDCPPSLGRASKCAVFTSHEIYVPAHMDELSNVGLRLLDQKISKFESASAQDRMMIPAHRLSEIRAVILNGVQARVEYGSTEQTILTRIHSLRDKPVVSDDADIAPVRIRHTIEAARGPLKNRPIVTIPSKERNSDLLEDYMKLTQWIHENPLKTRKRVNEPKKKNR